MVTAVLAATRPVLDQGSRFILYLLAVLATATAGGMFPALLSALLGVGLLNWYFVEPRHGLAVDDPNQVVALIVFSAVAITAGTFVTAFARRTAAVERANREAEALAATAAKLAESDALRTAILRAVSHDLRTPLAAIKASATSLLRSDVDWPPDELHEFLLAIDQGTDRLDRVIGDLLDAGRLEAGAISPDVQPTALDDVLAVVLSEHAVLDQPIRVDIDPSLPLVYADPGLLGRAVSNIVANALAHSPSRHPPAVVAKARGDVIDVRVIDRGPGIAATERERVFLPFQRHGDAQRPPGIGLGLHIAKGFVEAMRGTIALEETAGGGLTAVIRLRAADEHL